MKSIKWSGSDDVEIKKDINKSPEEENSKKWNLPLNKHILEILTFITY